MKTSTAHQARTGLTAGVLAGLLTGCAAEASAREWGWAIRGIAGAADSGAEQQGDVRSDRAH
jgi:hypothetical protein